MKDYDMEDVEAIKKLGEEWDEYKKAIYQQTILDQYHKRKIDDYKCY